MTRWNQSWIKTVRGNFLSMALMPTYHLSVVAVIIGYLVGWQSTFVSRLVTAGSCRPGVISNFVPFSVSLRMVAY
ncbi:MAG: hypothetical protein OXE77_10285 [Flavobacteriaceae bacterium]|nr:hypothetical protein [Flavobacteriaceae bacterium]MCY4266419.1 hypothetical protein [Flavobacteriaceae bacterium]